MRRVILAVTGTVAGLIALLSFKSHAPAQPAAAAGPASGPAAAARPAPSTAGSAGQATVTGQAAETAYGPVQVQLTEDSGKIVKVAILQQPASTEHDLQLGQAAFPRLIGETLTAQSATIDAVSGATYTSEGYISSLQSALDRAR